MTKPKLSVVPAKTKTAKTVMPPDIATDLAAFAISPLRWMLSVVNDPKAEPARRDRMAASAAQYLHRRLQDGGVKEARDAEARKVAKTDRFKTGTAPKRLRGQE